MSRLARASKTVGVKICGISDAPALDAAAEAGADWVGFVFAAQSPRVVTPARAAELHRRLAGRALTVGLFVEPSEHEIERAVEAVPLDVLQLYVTADRAMALRARFGLPVWLAVGVAVREDLPTSAGPDGFVVESRPSANSNQPGGNGIAFDWSIARSWTAPAPWLLAGGLTADNVGDAIRTSGAEAVDVSSGVERARGIKDPAMIRRFVEAARRTL